MSLTLNHFLRVTIEDSPSATQTQDQTLAVYVTDKQSDQFINNLYMYASTQREVEQAFGTDSEIAKATLKAFSSKRRPRRVMIAFWNKEGTATIARPNSIVATQAPIPVANIKNPYSFTIKARNVTESVTYTPESLESYDNLVAGLNTALGESSRFIFSYQDNVITLASKVNGEDVDTDNVTIEKQPTSSHDISDDLRLTINRDAKFIRGVSAKQNEKQTIVDLISELDDKQPNYYGFYSTVDLTDTDITSAHDRLLASNRQHFFALTIMADYMLEPKQSNPIYQIASKNSRLLNAQLNKLGDKHAAVEYMVQACSTNWAAVNSAQTMKFKEQQSVQVDEGITSSMAARCDYLGINYYTDYDGIVMLSQGRTVGLSPFFTDSQVGRHALADGLRVDIATRLKALPKVPQTDEGQVILHNSCIPRLEQFVNNGFGARNQTWNGNGFGELSTGDVLELGYYMYSDSYNLQPQADREARKAMPTMIAFKESGAIHEADFTVYVER